MNVVTSIGENAAEVSLVVVNYNAGVFLSRSVCAALRSDANVEVIVVDNASTDDSIGDLERACAGDDRVRVVTLDHNAGFGAAVNIGADLAQSPYLMLLNPDCFLRPSTVSGLIEAMVSRPQAGIVGPLVFDTAGIEQRGARRDEPTPARAVARSFGRGGGGKRGGYDLNKAPMPDTDTVVDAVSGSCLLIDRTLFEQLGRMDEAFFLHCEDLDLCRRVRDANREVVFVPGHSVVHIQGASGRNVTVERFKHRSMIRYFDKHHGATTSWWLAMVLKAGVWARFGVVALRSAIGPSRRLSDSDELARVDALLSPGADDAVVVTGATSFVAEPLLRLLDRREQNVIAVSRKVPRGSAGGRRWITFDYLRKVPAHEFSKLRALIHLAPIWVLPGIFTRVLDLGVSTVVAVGSSSVETKRDSDNEKDHGVARKIAEAEQRLMREAASTDVSLIVLHPTLVYDAGARDANVGRLIRFARRFRFLPVVEPSTGLRQPLHANDLAALSLKASDVAPGSRERVFVTGGETLRYRQMLERIAQTTRPGTRLLKVPTGPFKFLLNLVGSIPGGPELNGAMLDRVNQDMVFSNARAQELFGFEPRAFDVASLEDGAVDE